MPLAAASKSDDAAVEGTKRARTASGPENAATPRKGSTSPAPIAARRSGEQMVISNDNQIGDDESE
eukprot:CAMPEP_0195026424 /NCGR_PEP_ID=MMETSP0326_2-20130528/50233_1 /TAXON_ID=2866 ORGANISM="Crypthecodinium cohnii, Strain Seligo" /NCGR_SAMPLE_ID=MMETSP0326_2 /ASSEMBLY_ACC=CAM_ASM_000348 /LENGTH=65 /DNA_ID=CAMNT_0040048259 /DNA_START=1 /DNA_END=195 /DNA_ORIENTATION=+